MITLLLTLPAYAAPCVDAITDEAHEYATYQIDSSGGVEIAIPGDDWWTVAIHCGPVSLRGSRVPWWAEDLTPGTSRVGGGTGAGMDPYPVVAAITFDPWGPTTYVTIPAATPSGVAYLAVDSEAGYQVRVNP